MYAVIKTGGKQYKVEPGNQLKVEKIKANPGDTVSIPAVLIKDDTGNITFSGTVEAEIVKHAKHKKVIVFKFKRKKRYSRKRGHRQPYTLLKVKEIKAS
ncbi:MAG: 50S ribosomal protein L21 [Aquificae bacterium]|nr:50S ribosomal protein L21 [Aquificota bacterium]